MILFFCTLVFQALGGGFEGIRIFRVRVWWGFFEGIRIFRVKVFLKVFGYLGLGFGEGF